MAQYPCKVESEDRLKQIGNENFILVIRDCYKQLYEFITQSGNGCHLLILGKAGVGKSTFILWLLYEIWDNAKSLNKEIPSIVVVDRDGITNILI